MQIFLFEDEGVSRFRPLLHLKPVYDLRLGMMSLREKFESRLGSVSLHARRILEPYLQETNPQTSINRASTDDTLFLNGRVICDAAFAEKVNRGAFEFGTAYFNGGQLVAFRTDARKLFSETLPDVIEAKFISERMPVRQISCDYVGFMWDLIRLHPQEFLREARTDNRFGKILGNVHPRATLVNESKIFIDEGAEVKAGAVLDADAGYIIISKNATVLPNAVLMNNVFVGEGATVKIGAKIYSNVYIGKKSKAGGEIEDSILEPFSNKQHDGFLGHSYLSSWCNLGADTNTSDLKNNYSAVRMAVNGKEVDTKMQFLGLIMGEHSKSGINTMFNTGTVVGLSSNIFGGDFPPKTIGDFAWGGAAGFERFKIEKALEVARAVMKRRGIELSDAYETLFRAAFESSLT
jgi:UDP-N-acetylglucosamine diphosphorylase / glucose-1-phosphate thymidylyltransferase / UDP-N-acetylgalactosamine diphosphorylase / glucosamine-1-phosphate N-acetyltransferase / galactosamine-1-phosphate N-acetyltransferase